MKDIKYMTANCGYSKNDESGIKITKIGKERRKNTLQEGRRDTGPTSALTTKQSCGFSKLLTSSGLTFFIYRRRNELGWFSKLRSPAC